MASPFESAIRKQVAAAFSGRLLRGTLRRVTSTSVDARGNPVPGPATQWGFDGIVDSFSAYFAAQAGIPVTDARILIIAGSLRTTPQQDDQILMRGQYYQLRRLIEVDPAGATYIFAGFAIAINVFAMEWTTGDPVFWTTGEAAEWE